LETFIITVIRFIALRKFLTVTKGTSLGSLIEDHSKKCLKITTTNHKFLTKKVRDNLWRL